MTCWTHATPYAARSIVKHPNARDSGNLQMKQTVGYQVDPEQGNYTYDQY